MIGWLRRYFVGHREAAADTYLFVVSRSFGTLVVWLILGVGLALPSGLYLLSFNLLRVQTDWSERPAVTAFFAEQLSEPASVELTAAIRAVPGVTDVQFVAPDAALRELQERMAIGADLALLDDNPLPGSARIRTARGADVATVEQSIAALSGVEHLVSERTWLERLAAIADVINTLAMLLGATMALLAAAVAGSAVRLAIDDRLEEVLVMDLVGATHAQIRRPFLYLGLWYGLGGGVLAALLASLGIGVLEGPLATLSDSYGVAMSVQGFNWRLVAALVGVGCGLGVVGAWLSAMGSAIRVSGR